MLMAEASTVITRLEGIMYGGVLPVARLSLEELTSHSMSVVSAVTSGVWAKSFWKIVNSGFMEFTVWFAALTLDIPMLNRVLAAATAPSKAPRNCLKRWLVLRSPDCVTVTFSSWLNMCSTLASA